MTIQRQIDRLLAQRASEWVETLRTAGPLEREAFVDWLRESRRHVEEFLSVVALDRELEGLDMQARFDRNGLLRRVSPAVAPLPVAAEPGGKHQPRRSAPRRWVAALAASLLMASLGLLLARELIFPVSNFVTATGERQSIELADGSIVQLNADSHVRARLHRSGRELELLRGEALFKVARDADRPFRVRARNAVVQALGTQFTVSARPADTIVSVIEGKVRVSSEGEAADRELGAGRDGADRRPSTLDAALAAGEQVVIETTGSMRRNDAADVEQAVAWRRQRLVFRKTSLEEIVRRFNSHNAAPKLRLIDIEPGSRHYSATFDADDPHSFGSLLEKERDLAVQRRPDEILISRRDARARTSSGSALP